MNDLNFSMQYTQADESKKIASITFESWPSADQPAKIQFLIQFLIDAVEETMSITNVELRIGADSIKEHFQGSLGPQFFQRQAKLQIEDTNAMASAAWHNR